MKFNTPLLKRIVICCSALISLSSQAQVADLTLSMQQFMTWTTPSNQSNVSLQPLQARVRKNNYQVNANLDTNARVLYCPDGMNNFGPYIDSAHQFNLFNFSHWQFIDILCWFGGTASDPITLPSKAWVDAAHKNGVKVIGTVFFAPTVYGGSQAQVQSFLQTDAQGKFIALKQLKDIATFYNFDGWIFNCETPVSSSIGAQMSSFIAQLDTAYAGDIIWYDSMLQNGSITYQNRLNANNAYFFTHSEGLFTNYAWSSANTVASSQSYATSISQSPYKVYTGADMWPTRNAQPAFSNYQWIDKIITNNVAKTSIALFATNFTYNYAGFSNFNNDSTDYQNFYDAENKIFSGLDLTPFATDVTWKGITNYIPARTTITSLPFTSHFNTGHGLNYYSSGTSLTTGSWHNMSLQSILPSWTFYNSGLTMKYNFNDAYEGGSSLQVTCTSSTAATFVIPLYSTSIRCTQNYITAQAAIKSVSGVIDSLFMVVKRKGNSDLRISLNPTNSTTWTNLNAGIPCNIGDSLIGLTIEIKASGPFQFNVGELSISESFASSITTNHVRIQQAVVYPNPSSTQIQFLNLSPTTNYRIRISDLSGKVLRDEKFQSSNHIPVNEFEKGIYIYELLAGSKYEKGTFVVK